MNADISAGNAATVDNGKPRSFIPTVGELRLADIFCAALLDM